ncbi:MAG: hypothetical protein Ct9H300mP12_06000 [Acidimicrobiales bacterium]|nr:MAG: hypothetical protein Ct9H300mP12_06000 [Acidimicrobiales bacterium]
MRPTIRVWLSARRASKGLVADDFGGPRCSPRAARTGKRVGGTHDPTPLAANLFLRCGDPSPGADRQVHRAVVRRPGAVHHRHRLVAVAAQRCLSPRFRVTTRHSRLWHDGAVGERFAAGFPARGDHNDDPVNPGSGAGWGGEDGGKPVRWSWCGAWMTGSPSASMPRVPPFMNAAGGKGPRRKGPLRESVAAGLLASAGWDPLSGTGRSHVRVRHHCHRGGSARRRDASRSGSRPGPPGHGPLFEPGTWARWAPTPTSPGAQAPVPEAPGPPPHRGRRSGCRSGRGCPGQCRTGWGS